KCFGSSLSRVVGVFRMPIRSKNVILDGRCLCVGSCCCLNLSPFQNEGPRQLEKICRQRSYGSDEETRLDDRSCRTSVSSREDSAQWSVDEMTTSSLALYRTRRFVSIPSDGDSIDDRRPPEECDRSRLRRAFFEESTCHW
ncbi:unnamed protein product, partial [Effrenium voratum]